MATQDDFMMDRRGEREYSVNLGSMAIEGVRPVVKGRLMSKIGRISLRGFWNGKDVKIYECASPEHASFVAETITKKPHSIFFPEVYNVHESFIVSEWVNGKEVKPRWIRGNQQYSRQLGELLGLLHGTFLDVPSKFDYVEDLIRPRFVRCCQTLGLAEFQENALQSWRIMSRLAEKPSLSHPDLSPANMILTAQGKLKIIDNELLGVSPAPWFDLLNILFFLGEKPIKDFSLVETVITPLLKLMQTGHNEHLLYMWLMRFVGARFVAGDIEGVVKMASAPIERHLETISIWKNLQ
jgi:serine/threonine protein kinase